MGLTASDEICTPWYQDSDWMPYSTIEYVSVGEKTLADIFATFGEYGFIFSGTMYKPGDQEVYHYEGGSTSATIQIDKGILKITVAIEEYNKSLSEKDFNDTSIGTENPNYDPSDPENAKEFFYDTEPGANIAAYTALNSWEPYTGVEEQDMGILPDSIDGKYGKLGDSTYILKKNE